jgi:hypothetical protein
VTDGAHSFWASGGLSAMTLHRQALRAYVLPLEAGQKFLHPHTPPVEVVMQPQQEEEETVLVSARPGPAGQQGCTTACNTWPDFKWPDFK